MLTVIATKYIGSRFRTKSPGLTVAIVHRKSPSLSLLLSNFLDFFCLEKTCICTKTKLKANSYSMIITQTLRESSQVFSSRTVVFCFDKSARHVKIAFLNMAGKKKAKQVNLFLFYKQKAFGFAWISSFLRKIPLKFQVTRSRFLNFQQNREEVGRPSKTQISCSSFSRRTRHVWEVGGYKQ